jgi:hypothetical protein
VKGRRFNRDPKRVSEDGGGMEDMAAFAGVRMQKHNCVNGIQSLETCTYFGVKRFAR